MGWCSAWGGFNQGEVLLTAGANWKYLDTGTNLGTGWTGITFADGTWAEGPAPLGYGESNLATTVSFGADPDNKYVTTYFRQSFLVPNAQLFNRLFLNVLRDDVVVVHLNGQEVYRNNMPAGVIGNVTLAVTNVYGIGEQTYYAAVLSNTLVSGTNVLAAEIHQAGNDSIDVKFDLQLAASNVVLVTRGPYLQVGTTNGILIRWRTGTPTDSRVRYGTSADNLELFTDDGTLTTEHQVSLSGLLPDTQYFYSVGTSSEELAKGADYFFVTAPLAAKPTRLWVLGDCGTAGYGPLPGQNQRRVRDAYYAFTGTRYTDLLLLLGDNAYPSGTDQHHQIVFFDIYPTFLRPTVVLPCIGNHETYATFDPSDFPYLQIFNPPVNGEAGGIPSGTKKYYSYDYANIHFVCLDSMTSDRSAGGPMCTWLQQDLAANTNEWSIAFWHHPPYTKGSHDSDDLTGVDGELVEMRVNVLPILEAYGVDLVLGGHSHCYERSYLLKGHYDYSWTLTSAMIKNDGDGRRDGNGPYLKPVTGPSANQGTVYVVAGSAGQATFGAMNHPAMYISLLRLGSLVLDIQGSTLEAKFVRDTGAIEDYFTIIKGDTLDSFRILAISFGSGVPELTWNTAPGTSYQVLRRDSLEMPWVPVSSVLSASGTSLSWPDNDCTNRAAFYRVVSPGN